MPVAARIYVLLLVYSFAILAVCHDHGTLHDRQAVIQSPELTKNGIPFSTRAHWMRTAIQSLPDLVSPCPFAAFGAVIVNHTNQPGLGELICIGANNNSETGNPTLHGEIAAINNCTTILTNPAGQYKLSPLEALDAWSDLTLYTTAESCPMCASAIRWAGFKEYVYATTIDTLVKSGWGQITISSYEVFSKSWPLGTSTAFLGEVLANETDPYFLWQFDPEHSCPNGCIRDEESTCVAPAAG